MHGPGCELRLAQTTTQVGLPHCCANDAGRVKGMSSTGAGVGDTAHGDSVASDNAARATGGSGIRCCHAASKRGRASTPRTKTKNDARVKQQPNPDAPTSLDRSAGGPQ